MTFEYSYAVLTDTNELVFTRRQPALPDRFHVRSLTAPVNDDSFRLASQTGLTVLLHVGFDRDTCLVLSLDPKSARLLPLFQPDPESFTCAWNDSRLSAPDSRQQQWGQGPEAKSAAHPGSSAAAPVAPATSAWFGIGSTVAAVAVAAPRAVAALGSRFGGGAAITHGLKLLGGGIGMTTGLGVLAAAGAVAGIVATKYFSGGGSSSSDADNRAGTPEASVPVPVHASPSSARMVCVLALEDGAFLVETTDNWSAREAEHRRGECCAWTQEHKFVELRSAVVEEGKGDEMKAVLGLIHDLGEEKGPRLVRGGWYTYYDPSHAAKQRLIREYRLAYACGSGSGSHKDGNCPEDV